MKISDKIQIKVDQKIKQKLYAIDLKYKKIESKNAELLETKKQREIDKAKRVSTKWWEDQERKTQGKALKPKTITNSVYKAKADFYFSRCIRWYWAWEVDWVWYNKCDTTWAILPIKELTVWHYKNRSVLTLRYCRENCTVQTAWQNQKEQFDDSQKVLHKIAIIKKYWPLAHEQVEFVERMRVMKKNPPVDLKHEYELRKDYYEKNHAHQYL